MSNKHYAAQRYSLFNHPMKGRIQPKDVTKHLAKGSGASFPSFGVHAANFISLFPICFFFFLEYQALRYSISWAIQRLKHLCFE